jgi:hypothetical protein
MAGRRLFVASLRALLFSLLVFIGVAALRAILRSYPEETRAINAAYHQRIHRDQASLIPLDPEAFRLGPLRTLVASSGNNGTRNQVREEIEVRTAEINAQLKV